MTLHAAPSQVEEFSCPLTGSFSIVACWFLVCTKTAVTENGCLVCVVGLEARDDVFEIQDVRISTFVTV